LHRGVRARKVAERRQKCAISAESVNFEVWLISGFPISVSAITLRLS
jgi:hypothetical protein